MDAVNAFAADLAARFNPTVGCTRSWDTADPTDFTVRCALRRALSSMLTCLSWTQVIIDNMMNLEVLFASANLTGNDTLRQIATSHADKTMQNHVRSDGTAYSRKNVFKLLALHIKLRFQALLFMSLNTTRLQEQLSAKEQHRAMRIIGWYFSLFLYGVQE